MLLEKKMSEFREQLMIKAMNVRHITPKQAKTLAIKKGDLSFFVLADTYIDQLEKLDKVGTADKVRSIFAKFESFLGGRSATFYDIDENTILDYQEYLKNTLKNGVNTIHTNLKSIRRVFSIAIEKNIIGVESDPFKKVKLKTEKSIRPFLSQEEIKALMNLRLDPGSELEKARDVFIWTIFTGGMRISDVLMLKKSNIKDGFISNRIKKTGVPHRIKMPEYANKLLQKYSIKSKLEDGYVFQMIPNTGKPLTSVELDRAVTLATSTYNQCLKKLAKLAGIQKPLSSHIARISFITMAVSSGVDMTTVQGIAGHADLEMTAMYSKYVDNQGSNALSMLEKNIFLEV
jgi:site-specific recombinase XerD